MKGNEMTGNVTVNGRTFEWTARKVEAGSEWEVTFSEGGTRVAVYVEPMRPADIAQMFVDVIESEAIMLENPDMLDV